MPNMPRLLGLLVLALVVGTSSVSDAQAKKKYHFELAAVTPKPEVKPDVAKISVPRVEGQVKKTFETHPQLVATLDGAPAKEQEAEYRKYLKKKGLAGAYLVTVEVTEASEELAPTDKPKTQRLVVRVGVHILGETIPGRTMGFTGDGKATIKQEVGMKVRERDREAAWDSAAEVAIADAMKTVFTQLAVPPKKQ
jgi:hypothetical protein